MSQPPLPPGWTAGDIVLITAAGVVFASIVGAVGASIAASINAWSARRIARDNARRELVANSFKPYAKNINQRIKTCHRVMTVGSRIAPTMAEAAARARESGQGMSEQDRQELTRFGEELIALAEKIGDQHISDYDPAMMAHGDQKLIDANALWINSVSTFTVRAGEFNFAAEKKEHLAELQQLVWRASQQGAIVLAVMQEVIIGRPRWRSAVYRLARKFGRARIRI
jgi:hypothetical protein